MYIRKYTHSFAWHHSFRPKLTCIFATTNADKTCHIHICHATHSCRIHTHRIHACVKPHPCVWWDSSTRTTWRIHTIHTTLSSVCQCDMASLRPANSDTARRLYVYTHSTQLAVCTYIHTILTTLCSMCQCDMLSFRPATARHVNVYLYVCGRAAYILNTVTDSKHSMVNSFW